MSNWVRWRRRCDSSSFLRLHLLAASLELVANLAHRPLDGRLVGGVMGGRPDAGVLELRVDLAREGIEMLHRLDLVAEEDGAERALGIGREDLERLAPDPERTAAERLVVARVLHVHELAQDRVAIGHVAPAQHQHLLVVLLRRAHAIDAGHARHHNHVPPAEECGGGGVPEPVDLVVDRGVLLDVEVLARNVCLGLVVVVVGDEVLDGVVGEELPKLVAELRGERLVVRDHERRPLHLLDREGHRGRLARPRDAEERLETLARAEPVDEPVTRALGWSATAV